MPSLPLLKALGLNFSPNQLEVAPGSLVEASNVIIRRDNVIESRRGYALYGTAMGSSSDRCKQLLTYKNKLLRHFSNRLQYEDGLNNAGVTSFFDFNEIVSGSPVQATIEEAQAGLRIKSIEANSNLYLTTSEGIKKISAKSASTFPAVEITQAGGVKALDAQAFLNAAIGDQTSFLSADAGVAYKVVWGTKDASGNLILGTPSDPITILNPLLDLTLKDFSNLLLQIDNVGNTGNSLFANPSDYYSTLALPLTATSVELRDNLIFLAKKIDEDFLFATDTGAGTLYQPLNISGATISAGTVTVNFAIPGGGILPSAYFLEGDNINVPVDIGASILGFTSNGVGVDNINTNQVVTAVGAASVSFVAKDYTTTNSVGISGTITNIPTGAAGAITITAPNHGLKNSQIVTIAGSNSVPNVNGTYTITYQTPNTFSITVGAPITTAGNQGTWDISINGFTSAKIESYNLRSVPVAEEQNIPATNNQLVSLKDYYSNILISLQDFIAARGSNIVNSTVYSNYLASLDVSSNASVTLKITIPPAILDYTATTNPYFYQIYRTDIAFAEGVSTISDIAIIQEYTQIEEKFPTSGELSAGIVTFLDNTPESIAGTGANLYTNERTGEGGLQANDVPPFALDINQFKGYTFFSNTRTRQRKTITLIGVVNMINNYNPSDPYKLTISDGTTTNTYQFVVGAKEITQITCGAASAVAGSGASDYFTINSANDETEYYVWFQKGTSADPALTVPALLTKTGVKVVLETADGANTVASKVSAALSNVLDSFTSTVATNVATITNTADGAATDASFPSTPPTGFSITITQQGVGENVASKQVLLSSDASVGIAIEETAKSLIRIINQNTSEFVNAFYISGTETTPGTVLLEGRNLSSDEFYIMGSDSIIGESFNPDLSPGAIAITGISIANPTVITAVAHGLLNGDRIVISNSNSTPSVDGVYQITYLTPNTFSIPVNVTVAGTSAAFESVGVAEISSNEEQPHRVYHSKFQQPEAVPLLNYLDIGATDKKILRIFPLRDSLFVFKEDGLFRISGEVAPFTVALFDSSCILLAPDSVAVSNNQVYGWTTQGVSTITEAGVNIISRAIDTEILKKASSQFTNFKTATWGVGYESDNSYTVYTTAETTDTRATIGFRYSNLTNSWTTVDKTATAGILNPADDKLYLGAGNTNYLEKERKEFTRYDYADRELPFQLVNTALSGASITLSTVSGLAVGDVVVQDQTLTVYEFNMLLQKLDNDPGVNDSDYYATLQAVAGNDLRDKLEDLALKLDADVTPGYFSAIASLGGSITSASIANPTQITTAAPHGLQTGRRITISGNSESEVNGSFEVTVTGLSTFTIPVDLLTVGSGGAFITNDESFEDIKTCYNIIISRLNADPIVSYSNYRSLDNNTIQEAIISSINLANKTITLNLSLEYVVGAITIYKAISCRFTYSPLTMGDPLGLKHMRESTTMFANKAFTSAKMEFSTDLLPEVLQIPFNGDGNGIFGHQTFGSGFFGGGSNAAPFRTFIPRQCQRCRFLNVGFVHSTAREQFAIYGITLTGEVGQSTRAYR